MHRVPMTLTDLFDGCRPLLAMIENPPDELRYWALAVAAELAPVYSSQAGMRRVRSLMYVR